MEGLSLKVSRYLSLPVLALVVLVAGCGIEEPLERVRPEPRPYTNRLSAAYDMVQLRRSSSADVLSVIKQYENKELISQSESVVASCGEKKKTSQFWLNMVGFDEEDFKATRKYFMAVDEKPWHLGAEGQKLAFDCQMILDDQTLSEPYTSENQKRIAILTKALENFRNDISQVSQDSRTLNEGKMMANQTIERILYVLKQSPSLAEKLDDDKGLDFDHPTFGKSRVRMRLEDKYVLTLKIRIGWLYRIWDKE